MSGGGILGGGVIFVIAAVLWAAVLVPTWWRRREFRAAEHNALRLQRTVRVLAESAEVPHEVRFEANAREAVAQQKLLASAERRQESERAAQLSEARAAERRAEILVAEALRREKAAGRASRLRAPITRRLRSVAALVALLGVLGTLLGAGFALAGLGVAALSASVLLLFAAAGALVLLAPGRAKVDAERRLPEVAPIPEFFTPAAAVAAAPIVGRTAAEHAEAQAAAAERIAHARARAHARQRARASGPTVPQRVPHADSMLLGESVATASVLATSAAAASFLEASAPADAQAVAAEPSSPLPAMTVPARPVNETLRAAAAHRRPPAQRSQELAAALRLQRMGVIGDTSTGMPDLDEVMRRRREVG